MALSARPGVLITVYIGQLNGTGASPQPTFVGNQIVATTNAVDLLQVLQVDNTYAIVQTKETGSIDSTGKGQVILPQQSDCIPSTLTWILTIPNSTPQGLQITGPVTAAMVTAAASRPEGLYPSDLLGTYGWTRVNQPTLQNVTTVQGTPGSPQWKGIYSALATYAGGDAVSYGGSSFVATGPLAPGTTPPGTATSNANWTVLAGTALATTNPMTGAGDMIFGAGNGAATRLPAGLSSQVLIGGATPSFGMVPTAALALSSMSVPGITYMNMTDPRRYGSVGSGVSNPLSGTYGTLAAAQAAFPLTTAFLTAKGLPAIALTDEKDWAALQEAICAARSGGQVALSPVYVTTGTYLLNRSLYLRDQYSLSVVGGGALSTIFQWNGPANGVMVVIQGVREALFSGFKVVGDGATTTGLTYDGTPAGIVTTDNHFSQVFFTNHMFGCRIGGVTHYQSDQTSWMRCLWSNCNTIGVSIEDANSVFHDFYDCEFLNNARSISATYFLSQNNPNGTLGTGGSFNLFGCGFVVNYDWDVEIYNSARGTAIHGCWWERCPRPLRTNVGTHSTSVDIVSCSINGVSYYETIIITGVPTGGTFTLTYKGQTTAPLAYNATPAQVQTALTALSTVGAGNMLVSLGPNMPYPNYYYGPTLNPYTGTATTTIWGVTRYNTLQVDATPLTASASFTGGTAPAIAIVPQTWHFEHGSTGAMNVIGGRYDTEQTNGALPFKFQIGANNNHRSVITSTGVTYCNGDPYRGMGNGVLCSVFNMGCQIGDSQTGDAAITAGSGLGPLSWGSFTAPNNVTTNPNAWWYGAAWFKIPSGTILGAGSTSWSGSSLNCTGSADVMVDNVASTGGLAQPFQLSGKDTNASVANTFSVTLSLATPFTLTSDLVFHVRFEPEAMHY